MDGRRRCHGGEPDPHSLDGTAERDRGVKLGRYRLHGVRGYWVVDPGARTVETWDLAAGVDEPVVAGDEDVLRWTPAAGMKTLEIEVGALLARGGGPSSS